MKNLFDKKAILNKRTKRHNKFKNKYDFLHVKASQDISEKLYDFKKIKGNAIINGYADSSIFRHFDNYVTAGFDITHEYDIVFDDERLPFAPKATDFYISNLTLHCVNDLVGTLIQIRQTLRDKGIFIGSIFGGNTLHELREVLVKSEMQISEGVTPRVIPMIKKEQLSSLMLRSGFEIPVIDSQIFTVSYSNIYDLMRDIKGMGEGNYLCARTKKFTSKKLFDLANDIYSSEFPDPEERSRIRASFEIIYATGSS